MDRIVTTERRIEILEGAIRYALDLIDGDYIDEAAGELGRVLANFKVGDHEETLDPIPPAADDMPF